jgi:hypothetical protein
MSSLWRGPILAARLVPSAGCRVSRRRGHFNMQQVPIPVQFLHLNPLVAPIASTIPVGLARALMNSEATKRAGRKGCEVHLPEVAGEEDIMPLVNIVIALIIVGVVLWLINTFIPMASSIKTILNVVVVVSVVIWVLQAVGMWGRITSYKFVN